MADPMSELHMAMLNKCEGWIHEVDPKIPTERDPNKRDYFRKETIQYRDELRDGRLEFVKIRRAKLKRLFLADMAQQIQSVRRLGYDYIPTQP